MASQGEHMPEGARARVALDRELIALRDAVLALSYRVDQALERALEALRARDVALARQIVADDAAINTARYEIERECYRLLALQQPTARDLRAVVTAIHIVVELERIGDHVASIAKTAEELAAEPLLKPLVDIPRMAQITRDMLEASLSAYLERDVTRAEQTIARDDEIDQLDTQVTRELLTYMLQDPQTISRALKLQWVAHNLERSADRIVNICERVVFMVTGELTEGTERPNR